MILALEGYLSFLRVFIFLFSFFYNIIAIPHHSIIIDLFYRSPTTMAYILFIIPLKKASYRRDRDMEIYFTNSCFNYFTDRMIAVGTNECTFDHIEMLSVRFRIIIFISSKRQHPWKLSFFRTIDTWYLSSKASLEIFMIIAAYMHLSHVTISIIDSLFTLIIDI